MNMIRTLKTQTELDEAIHLANQVFFQCESFFERRYPHVFSLRNIDHLYGYFSENRLVSFVATYPTFIQFEDRSLSACMLGAVCTDPKFQGQGLSMQVLKFIEERLNKTCDLLMISGEGKNYLRLGAQVVGSLYEVHFPQSSFKSTQHPYHVLETFENLKIENYYQAYLKSPLPKFNRRLDEQSLMLKGHFEQQASELNVVLMDEDQSTFVCVRVAYEGTVKIAFVIEMQGNIKRALEWVEDYALKMSCDKVFYRTATPPLPKHTLFMIKIPITGTIKVINPKLAHDAYELFGDLTQKGLLPSLRVDDLNFL